MPKKLTILFLLTLIFHVSAKDAWNYLIESEKEIIRKYISTNYNGQKRLVDTFALVHDAYWENDSVAHIKFLDMRSGNLDDPEVLELPFETTIDELGDLKYLEHIVLYDNLITNLWNTIDKNDNLIKISDVDNLITLPKTIAGCEKLNDITMGWNLEYLPDEFLDLHLFPFTDWSNINARRGEIDLCGCSEEKFTLTAKQKAWADVTSFTEYKTRFCDSLSDSAIVAELFRRNGYKDIDMSKAVRFYPNSNRIDSVIIRDEDFPEIKRLNLWINFETMIGLKYLEISGIDTLYLERNNIFRTYWASDGSDTIVVDSLREIMFNNIKHYSVYDVNIGGYEQTLSRKFFRKFSLRNCNLNSNNIPQFYWFTKASPLKVDYCENKDIIFDNNNQQWFKEYGYDIETYDDYEDAFCHTDAIEPAIKVSSKSFSVSHSKSALKIILPQSSFIKTMKLLTVDGRVVKEFTAPKRTTFPTQFSLPLSDSLSAGIYIFSLVTDSEQFQQRFVVE